MADNVPTNHPCDGPVLHFLKELPGWVVVFVALIFFTAIYLFTRDDFMPRVLDALMGAFLGLVVAQRPRPQTVNNTPINTETVQTDAVNPAQMDVTTETVNIQEGEFKS